MNKIRLVAFDLDGTIGDTIPLCIKAFKEAVAPYIGHELSDDDVIRTFGLNEQGMIASLVDAPYKERALADFYTFYKNLHEQLCPRPFSGIRDNRLETKRHHRGSCNGKRGKELRHHPAAIQDEHPV